MKQILVSALVAALVSGGAIVLFASDDAAEADARVAAPAAAAPSAGTTAPLSLSYTAELGEDAWVDAARTAGTDHKPLADAANSICFLTRIEIAGVQSPADTNSCSIGIDDFTGFWEVRATVEEGGRSSVRCNARCLVWE